MKTTKLYHGSNKGFKKLKVSKKLTITTEQGLKEGYGIYCLDNNKLENCFKYMYEISVPTSEVMDFTKITTCRKYYNQIAKMLKTENINLDFIKNSIISDLIKNKITISNYEFIKEILENDISTCDIKDYKLDRIRRKYNKIIPKVFQYHDIDYSGKVSVIKDITI
ncbi:MAG: hypothetical protein ACRC5M_03495, partial [Anaeroplasmataceae bacterium]